MIIFDQLRMSDDAQRIYINVHVNTADVFDGIYLDQIAIKTADKVLEATTPELYSTDDDGKPIDAVYAKTFGDNVKEAALVVTVNDLTGLKTTDMSDTLFFVYVRCKGNDSLVPCQLGGVTTVGVTFDEKCLYQKVMGYTKALADSCTVPVGFTDFILLWNAFKASIETEHFVPAINYWNMLFDKDSTEIDTDSIIKGCGCHG